MTPKEKAKELVDKFYEYSDGTGSCERFYDDLAVENAKKCAIIMVDEIIEIVNVGINWISYETTIENKPMQYWLEIKDEINKL
ncbi:MAG TPA: hypothetical protein DCG75_01635 [Bacteroidales bacterium]|nr:hypothetical protein [Bacteroidales bacterium]